MEIYLCKWSGMSTLGVPIVNCDKRKEIDFTDLYLHLSPIHPFIYFWEKYMRKLNIGDQNAA